VGPTPRREDLLTRDCREWNERKGGVLAEEGPKGSAPEGNRPRGKLSNKRFLTECLPTKGGRRKSKGGVTGGGGGSFGVRGSTVWFWVKTKGRGGKVWARKKPVKKRRRMKEN